MKIRRPLFVVLVAGGAACMAPRPADAQCCLSELFSGCRKAPAPVAYAPVAAPIVAPIAAPIPAPPPPPQPVMVPVQQVSYVPETTYRTQYQCVPVTSYKPSCEVDPCTGASRECMEQVTQYVQQAVNVPVTQYRAVYSTKYVQMQPGYSPQAAYAMPGQAAPAMAAPATSPFASTVQATPQAWGAAGADVPQNLIQPGQQSIAAPTLPAGAAPQPGMQQPIYQQPGFQQQVVPQSGTYATPAPAGVQPQPTTPPMLAPAPSLKPIPELPKTPATNGTGTAPAAPAPNGSASGYAAPMYSAPQGISPQSSRGSVAAPNMTTTPPAPAASANDANGMPVLPGGGPSASTHAFPKLLEPTGHTTSWQPVSAGQPFGVRPSGYPTAALPGRVQ